MVSPGLTRRWNVALPTLARITFSAKLRASPTRMPAVCAMPSTIRLCGTIGNAGYRSCRCSSASETFFTAVADCRVVNSVNLSIQIQRTSGGLELGVDVVGDRVDGDELAGLFDLGVLLEFGEVGIGHALAQLGHAGGGDLAAGDQIGVV